MTRLVAGRLLLLDVVGTGSHRPVRRAWDLRARRQVVVKPGGTGAPHLEHPHVLPQEQIGDLAVSPFIPGGSLEQLLASYGALPCDLVSVLLDQLLDALSAVHDAGWVHRDVKPGNLLLDRTGGGRPHLWLADLGSARPIGVRGDPDGTPGYVAPEARARLREVGVPGGVSRQRRSHPPELCDPLPSRVTGSRWWRWRSC